METKARPGFWDLDYAAKCVRSGGSYYNKLKKAKAVLALSAMTWLLQHLPGGQALLEEVRSLAGRQMDGIGKKGNADHALQALREQAGLRPYTYTAAL